MLEDSLCLRVEGYARTHKLLPPGGSVVVAVSGGADSVVLLDVLDGLADRRGLVLHVAHLDHGLRADAQQDVEFVETLSRARRLTCHTARAEVSKRARCRGESVEEAGREERRAFLDRVAQAVGANRIALGHNLDDQAETVLMRLTRGAGLSGLAGIRPIRQNRWIRPLLCVSRAEIEAYAARHDLRYVTDSTNSDRRYLRNRVRHGLIPRLKDDVSAAVPAVIARSADLLRADDEFLEQTAVDALKNVTCVHTARKIALDGPKCFGYHISVQRRLFRMAAIRLGIDLKRLTATRLIDALERLAQGSARVDLTQDLTACFDGRLVVLGRVVEPFEWDLHDSGVTVAPEIGARVVASSDCALPRNLKKIDPFTAWFDRSRLGALSLRSIRNGDRLEPYGLSGTVKVHKLLIDQKIPRILRDEIPVVVSGNEPIWVVGLRTSARAPVGPRADAIRLEFTGDWRQLANAFKLPSSKVLAHG